MYLRVLGRAKEKISETKDRAIETIWMETDHDSAYGMAGALTYM